MLGRISSSTCPIKSAKPIDIVREGLICYIDASINASYPGTGTAITDLSGAGANGTIVSGTPNISFVSANMASYWNFGTANQSNYIASSLTQNYLDVTIVFYPDFSRVASSNIASVLAAGTPTSNQDKSLRFNGVNGTGPWTTRNGASADTNDWNPGGSNGTTYYINGTSSISTTANLASGWNIFGGGRTNTATGAFASPWAYYIGSGGYAAENRGFQGRIALMCLYNRILSSSEQLQNYGALRSRFSL
jgi:hypothetical protein